MYVHVNVPILHIPLYIGIMYLHGSLLWAFDYRFTHIDIDLSNKNIHAVIE